MQKINQERLKEVLNYDPESGVFLWKESGKGRRADGIAGTVNRPGCVIINIGRKLYRAHRLVWLYVYGYFPEHGIDHIDGNPWNNHIENLREASQSCNLRNYGNRKDNTSGVKGIYWDKARNKWCAGVRVNNRTKHLGRYTDFLEAVATRLAAEQCLDWENCDSSSPASQYVRENI